MAQAKPPELWFCRLPIWNSKRDAGDFKVDEVVYRKTIGSCVGNLTRLTREIYGYWEGCLGSTTISSTSDHLIHHLTTKICRRATPVLITNYDHIAPFSTKRTSISKLWPYSSYFPSVEGLRLDVFVGLKFRFMRLIWLGIIRADSHNYQKHHLPFIQKIDWRA